MDNQGKSFLYTASDIESLELALSPERFQPYIKRAGGCRAKGILLYERNTALSEALYGVTQATEVALRNSIHRALSCHHGPMWFDSVQLEETQADKVNKAKFEINRDKRVVTPGGVIAELNLGFWTSLVSARYEKALWVTALHKAFPNAKRTTRNRDGSGSTFQINRHEIFDQLERIRTLRNRIAHHEPILGFDLQKSYSETLDALNWVCPTSAAWVRSTNSFPERFYQKPLAYPPPKIAPDSPAPRPGVPVSRGKK